MFERNKVDSTLEQHAVAIDAVLDLRATPAFDLETPPRSGHWFFCDGQGRPLGELPGSPEIADGSSTFTIELRSHDSDGRFSLLRSGRFKSLYLYHRSMAVALRECLRWPAISARHFGFSAVSAPSLLPLPAARMIARISPLRNGF